jgi:hypothetical protein
MASRIFRVQRQPIPGADGEVVHCKPKRAPSKDRLCYRVCAVVEEAWICIAGLIARATFMPSLTGLGISLTISRHCRAGLQIVPSPFDKLRAGSTGLAFNMPLGGLVVLNQVPRGA